MFQFRGLTLLAEWYTFSVPGCPIRKSSDITLVCSSPKLIAAYHVLHRLSEPRHPPYALKCFKRVITITRHLQLKYIILFPNMSKNYPLASANWRRNKRELLYFLRSVKVCCWCYGCEPLDHYVTSDSLKELVCLFTCGGYRSRTDDPLRARQML